MNTLQIDKPFFELCQKSFHRSNTVSGLLPLTAFPFCFVHSCKPVLDLMIPVFTVRNNLFQLPVRKQIQTHFPDILFSEFRKDMGNVIGKYTVR